MEEEGKPKKVGYLYFEVSTENLKKRNKCVTYTQVWHFVSGTKIYIYIFTN